jgi:adenylosuccinate lyase
MTNRMLQSALMVERVADRLGLRAGPMWHADHATTVALGDFMALLNRT